MNWHVDWLPTVEQILADTWMNAPDRVDVTRAADRIDNLLSKNPTAVGESREGASRILICAPLAVYYNVIADDNKVVIWDLWRWTGR